MCDSSIHLERCGNLSFIIVYTVHISEYKYYYLGIRVI